METCELCGYQLRRQDAEAGITLEVIGNGPAHQHVEIPLISGHQRNQSRCKIRIRR